MTKWHHISLNSWFTVVFFNYIICFSVRFCDNLLLVLKMLFQVFAFASKKIHGFSSDSRLLMLQLLLLFHLQKRVSVFSNFKFYPRYLRETFIWFVKSTSFLRFQPRFLVSRAKQIERNLKNGFVDERQLKMITPK